MKIDRTRCLFGGALLAAGLTASAQAQFNIIDAYATTFAQEFAYGGIDTGFFNSSGTFAIAADVSNNYATAHGDAIFTNTSASTHASITGFGGYAYGANWLSFFQVDQDVIANVNWDWSQGFGYLKIHDHTDNLDVFFDSGSSSGTMPIALDNSHIYTLGGYSFVNNEGDHSTYWEINIPAPGSAGLLALAGLAAARRRRAASGRGLGRSFQQRRSM